MGKPSTDPMQFSRFLWPHIFYKEQKDLIYSVKYKPKTFVVGCNMSGKDFATAFAILWFFITRHPCRIVTTSADYSQLESVLWGEIRRLIQTSKYPLEHSKGGLLVVNHLHIRKVVNGQVCPLSYLIGRVAAKGEGMLGHHIAKTGDNVPRTLFVADEASGVDDTSFERAETWANRLLSIGNAYPCKNFFYKGVKAGDTEHSKVIRIRAEDSPNVKLALEQKKQGKAPTGELIIPGVLSWADYQHRRSAWSIVRQTISLDALFHEASSLLFPPSWLTKAERIADEHKGLPRQAVSIGVDPAEGGDSTVLIAIDEHGVVDLVSKKTPDTSIITGEIIAFMKKHKVPSQRVFIDRGGGGKEHADRLACQGYPVKTVGFGETISQEPKRGQVFFEDRVAVRSERYAYKNRRAEMYAMLRNLLEKGFGIPAEYTELHRQLAPIPLCYDGEGRMFLPPKIDLISIIGNSPDEADALVLAVYGLSGQRAKKLAMAF